MIYFIIMDHIMKNMKKIREMKKEQLETEQLKKPTYSLSYVKLVTGKCNDDEYDKLIHTISDVERYMIWTTPFEILLKDIMKTTRKSTSIKNKK